MIVHFPWSTSFFHNESGKLEVNIINFRPDTADVKLSNDLFSSNYTFITMPFFDNVLLPNFEWSRDVFIFSEKAKFFTKFKGLVSGMYVFIFLRHFISVGIMETISRKSKGKFFTMVKFYLMTFDIDLRLWHQVLNYSLVSTSMAETETYECLKPLWSVLILHNAMEREEGVGWKLLSVINRFLVSTT